MKQEYIQSTEEYKGFTLEIKMFCLDEKNSWHRKCVVYKDGNSVATCKSKKEAKDMIDNGCFLEEFIGNGQRTANILKYMSGEKKIAMK